MITELDLVKLEHEANTALVRSTEASISVPARQMVELLEYLRRLETYKIENPEDGEYDEGSFGD